MITTPKDVLNVKRGLSNAGYYDMDQTPEPHGYITKEMDEGIRQFQKDKGLRVDGYLLPGGETENALRQSQTAHTHAQSESTGRTSIGRNLASPLERIERPQDGTTARRDYRKTLKETRR